MKKLGKKQKIIGFIAILLLAIILAIVITTNVISNNNQVASEGYSATTANAGSALVASYIKNGITIGGITGTLEVLDTSDATATAEDIALGKTAYVDGEKITGTRAESISNEDLNISADNVYYADLDSSEEITVDGVIFADLAGEEESGDWGSNGWGVYTVPAETNLKQYYIKGEYTDTNFGEGKVIAPMEGISGNDRFYVMKLEDISGTFQWYHTNTSLGSLGTEEGFGKGRSNTKVMMEKENIYSNTVWGAINGKTGEETSAGPKWFVPSRAEWAVFGATFNITDYSYINLGLGNTYWTSSQGGTNTAYSMFFDLGIMTNNTITDSRRVRLVTTF